MRACARARTDGTACGLSWRSVLAPCACWMAKQLQTQRVRAPCCGWCRRRCAALPFAQTPARAACPPAVRCGRVQGQHNGRHTVTVHDACSAALSTAHLSPVRADAQVEPALVRVRLERLRDAQDRVRRRLRCWCVGGRCKLAGVGVRLARRRLSRAAAASASAAAAAPMSGSCSCDRHDAPPAAPR